MPVRHLKRLASVAAAGAIAVTATVAAAVPAHASGAIEIDYHTTGSTTLANPNSKVTVTFHPTTLQSFVTFKEDNTANIRAFLPLAPVTASFKAYGFLPARGTVIFTQVGPAVGVLGQYTDDGFPLSVTARYVVSLRNVHIGGQPANVGTNCQSINPVRAAVTAEPGFDLSTGTLDGTYNLSKFTNCGAAQDIINDTLPGSGNTLTLHIQLGDGSSDAANAVRARAHDARH